MAVTPDKPAPYAPAKVIIELIERHRSKGLPAPINADVLERAGISASLISRTLQTLIVLDLMDDDGRPTQTLEGMRLASQADYLGRMGEWLQAAYADALQFIDPVTATDTEIRDAFRKYTPTGQQDRMVTLFQALFRHAGLAPDKSPTSSASGRKKPSAASPKARVEPAQNRVRHETANGLRGNEPDNNKPKPQPQSDYMSALLAKFPDFDPAWPDDIKAKWFSGFDTFMKGISPQ